jgi:hypothetical protein
VTAEQRTQQQVAGELAARNEMLHEGSDFVRFRAGSDDDGRPVARLTRDPARAVLRDPITIRHEACERFGESRNQRLTRLGRQVLAREKRIADGR